MVLATRRTCESPFVKGSDSGRVMDGDNRDKPAACHMVNLRHIRPVGSSSIGDLYEVYKVLVLLIS